VAGSSGSLWLLGDYRCATGSCFTIMRSTNGGATFVRVAYPAASQPLSQPQDVGDEPFWFANAEDGYLYVSSATFGLYWTEDGGKMWRLVQPGGPLAWR